MKNILIIFCLLIAKTACGQSNPSVYIKNATYLDVKKGKYVTGVNILISDDQIMDIGKKVAKPAGAVELDATGKFIIPGLIDAHIHFFQSGGLYTRPDAIDLRDVRSYDDEIAFMHENLDNTLDRYLKVGITTVYDVGGPMANYDIRKMANEKEVAPNVFLTGPLVSTYQPKAFEIEDPPIIKVHTEEEAREVVRKQLPFKPDFIKIWYINLPDLTADQTFKLIQAAIDESHKHDLPVAVHATELSTAKLAVKAGANFLVHNVDDEPVDQEFIKLLKDNNVTLIPTMIVAGKYSQVFSQDNHLTTADFRYADPFVLGSLFDLQHITGKDDMIQKYKDYSVKGQSRLASEDAMRKSNLKALFDAGVKIATGTDAGNVGTQHASSYYEELEWMKASGMTNLDIIKASTINSAEILGKSQLGSINKGMQADLVITNIDPLKEINFVDGIEYTISAGHLIKTDTLLADTPEVLAQKQLNAYNARDIEAFLEPYAEDVKIYQFPNQLSMEGKEAMRKSYSGMFERITNLHCELVNRIVQGNTVIDHESVIGFGEDRFEAVAVYKIKEGKIAEVYFIR